MHVTGKEGNDRAREGMIQRTTRQGKDDPEEGAREKIIQRRVKVRELLLLVGEGLKKVPTYYHIDGPKEAPT